MNFRPSTLLFSVVMVTAALFAAPVPARAGGSGLNTLLVVNQSSSNSVWLGNYYRERRDIPAQNVLRITWPGSNIQWTRAEFESVLGAPVRNAVRTRGLTGQVEYVVLSMDIPYRVTDPTGVNGTTAALYYGFKADGAAPGPGVPASCSRPAASTNNYVYAEAPFRDGTPGNVWSNFMTFLLTAESPAGARFLVDQGVASDGTFPPQPVTLSKTFDPSRNIRYRDFDTPLLDVSVRGVSTMISTGQVPVESVLNSLGLETGYAAFTTVSNQFIPGAMADNLTSFGGYLFEASGQTPAIAFIRAGATATYGTVVEPCNYSSKFPTADAYFYQSRGFSIGECYYMSLGNPYQGILVGEPLAAPFARPGTGVWNSPAAGARLAGSTNLAVTLRAPDPTRPIQKVDLFVDGVRLRELTNILPAAGSVITVNLNGNSRGYTVIPNATLRNVASGLASAVNQVAFRNLTQVQGAAHGDRLELHSLTTTNRPGSTIAIGVTNAAGSAPFATTFVHPARPSFLDSPVRGYRTFQIDGTGTVGIGQYLQLIVSRTNAPDVIVAYTNTTPNISIYDFMNLFLGGVNSHPSLAGPDGLVSDDLISNGSGTAVQFRLRVRGGGIVLAQMQADFNSSGAALNPTPATKVRLDENADDLQPRDHLYVVAGATNLPLTFNLDTTQLADGWHELTAVGYEGSHVRTQTRVTRSFRVQNTTFSAELACVLGGTNAAIEADLEFRVTASTNTVQRLELFTTGGSVGVASNQASATFRLPAAMLGLGRHPFYAVATRSDGRRYRTATVPVNVVSTAPEFVTAVSGPPAKLSWSGVAGRAYEVLSSAAVDGPYTVVGSVTPTNCLPVEWIDPSPAPGRRFYRVRSAL